MNAFRLTVIAFSLILLSACGGGGGGGSGAGVGGGGAGGGGGVPPGEEIPPGPLVDAAQARTTIAGSVPLSVEPDRIEEDIESRAGGRSIPLFSNIVNLSAGTPSSGKSECTGRTCTANITLANTPTIIRFSLDSFGNTPQFAGVPLARFAKSYEPVMTHRGVRLASTQSAGLAGNRRLEFQTYGGWLDNSVFAVQRLTLPRTESGAILLSSYSFGDPSESNPSATPSSATSATSEYPTTPTTLSYSTTSTTSARC